MDWWQCESVKSQDKTRNGSEDAASQSGIIIHRVCATQLRRKHFAENIYMRMEWTRLGKKENIWSIRLGSHFRCLCRCCISFHLNNCRRWRREKKPNDQHMWLFQRANCSQYHFWILMSLKKKCHGFALLVKSYCCLARAADGTNNGRDEVFHKFQYESVAEYFSSKSCARSEVVCDARRGMSSHKHSLLIVSAASAAPTNTTTIR